jgi:hypothetical protein
MDGDTLFLPGNTNLLQFPRLNNRHQVVFVNTIFSGGKAYSRLWDHGHLYALGGETSYDRVTARALNDSGEVAGEVQYVVNDTSRVHAFATVGGQIQVLQSDPDEVTIAYSLNNHGVATGRSIAPPSGTVLRAVRWEGGNRSQIGPLPGHPADSQHYDFPPFINDAGTIAGNVFLTYSAYLPTYHRHGFYGTQGSFTEVVPFASGYTAYLWDINNQGQMAGESNGVGPGYTHAIVVEGGQKKDIHGTVFAVSLTSTAYAINDSGAVVGWWQGGRPLYYDNDTTWLLDSLLVTRKFRDGGSVGVLWEAIDINNSGVVLALYNAGGFTPIYPCLLVPVDSGTIVNTENDLPDLSPSDGRCYTGNVTALGEDECSLRAAIQHSNAEAGLDTIRFNIPVLGVPLIRVDSALPPVTERVVIDATTQPNTHRVEVMPMDTTMPGDGLTVVSGHTIIRGLLLNYFSESGLKLASGDSNKVEACHFGVRSDSVTARGNYRHGIHISGSNGNRIGNGFDEHANLIAHNAGAGIYVENSTANTFLRNIYQHNGGLGIDLAPVGVNRNDSLDGDAGANGRVNYPYVDSVSVAAGATTLFGTLVAQPNVPYVVEISRSDACDTCCNGEGKEAVWSTVATTNLDGVAHFITSFPGVLDPGEVYTLTATDTAKSTSEFSPCWPGGKRLYIVDGRGSAIRSRVFGLSRVDNDPPVFTETPIDSVVTDSNGWIDLSPYYTAGQLHVGDSIKISKVLDYRPRTKSGPQITTRSWTYYLDNGRFDSLDFHLYFDALDRECRQEVIAKHTTVGLNVVISVEWNADPEYLQLLQAGLRELSNYMYDVMDGQVRLDTVMIYSDAALWAHADVRIQATNALRPNADLDGVGQTYEFVRMPRRWFGLDSIAAAELSLLEWPMQPEDVRNYRTIGHELGHYMFGFGDEYFEDMSEPCVIPKKYGFMEDNYPGSEPSASEMSWARQYEDSACQNTWQWLYNRASCWDHWEREFQTTHNGVYAEIIQPAERSLSGSDDYFYGPNDYTTLDYDVGRLVEFRLQSTPKTTFDKLMFLKSAASDPMAGADVGTIQATGGRRLDQGLTASDGGIRLLGVVSGDSILANSGRYRSAIPGALAAASDSNFVWYSTAQELLLPPGDTLTVTLSAASGYLPANSRLDLSASDAVLDLDYLNAFGSVPSLQFWPNPDSGSATVLSMTELTETYRGVLPVSGIYAGTVLVRALDTASLPFLFPMDLTVSRADTAAPHARANAFDGSAYLYPDSVNLNGRIALLTNGYLPLRSGLDARARQLGPMVSIAAYPSGTFASAQLVLRYDDEDLDGAVAPFDLEVTARMYAWNGTIQEWYLLGGAVDSGGNFVSATVPGPGLYAAFTTGQAVGVEEDGHDGIRPDRYELDQNHPNPFNSSTTISYVLPVPGKVTLRIYNILGQTVRTVVDAARSAGRHEMSWDGKNDQGNEVGSGVYLYTLRSGDVVLTRRMVLMK